MLPFHQSIAAAALSSVLAASVAAYDSPTGDFSGDRDAGEKIAMDRGKGNCIACHMIVGGDSPGAIGPALIAMQTRYPSKEALAKQIWDSTIANPDAVMPPFGKHEVLTEEEFNDVVEYVWSL